MSCYLARPMSLDTLDPDASPKKATALQARVDEYNAKRTIRDVHVECGWKPCLDMHQLENDEQP